MSVASRNKETVMRMYGFYDKHSQDMDRSGILSLLSPDFVWDDDSHPTSAQEAGVWYVQPRRGIQQFQEYLDQEKDKGFVMERMEIKQVIADEDTVCVIVDTAGKNATTGKRFWGLELHQWTVGADSKLTSFRHWLDTGRHIEANTPDQ